MPDDDALPDFVLNGGMAPDAYPELMRLVCCASPAQQDALMGAFMATATPRHLRDVLRLAIDASRHRVGTAELEAALALMRG